MAKAKQTINDKTTKREPNLKVLNENLQKRKDALESSGWGFIQIGEDWQANNSNHDEYVETPVMKISSVLNAAEEFEKYWEEEKAKTQNSGEDETDLPMVLQGKLDYLRKNGWDINSSRLEASKKFEGDKYTSRISGAQSVFELVEAIENLEEQKKESKSEPKNESAETVLEIALHRIAPSRFEPQARRRARFTDEDLQSLADSIRQRGLRQPILLRPIAPLDELKAEFEIVFGERRFIAVQKAGLTKIRCFVESLTDAETVELQYEENHQRKESSPLDDAFLFKFLAEKENFSAEQLADKFNKKLKEVKQLLSLNNLIPEAVKEFEDGDLPLKHAIYLSSFPAASQKEIVEDELAYKWGEKEDGAASFKEFKEEVEENIIRNLANAPFDTEDERFYLKSETVAAKCSECPQRSGFEPLLFPDLKDTDSCLNKKCFDFKTNVSLRRQREAIALTMTAPENVGKTIDQVAEKVPLVTERSWVEKAEIPFKGKVLTDQKLLDSPECEHSVLSLAVDGAKKGQQVYVCSNKNCEVHNPKPKTAATGNGKADREALEKLEKEFNEKVRKETRHRIMSEAIKFFDDYKVFWQFDDLIQKVIVTLFRVIGFDTCRAILNIVADWKILPKQYDYTTKFQTEFAAAVEKLSKRQQSQILFLLVNQSEGFYAQYPQDGLKKIAKDYAKIDYAILDAQMRLELAPDEFKPLAEEHLNALTEGKESPIPRFWAKDSDQ